MTATSGRAYALLLGIGVAGALIWVAARLAGQETWRYWAALGVLTGAGLALALSQRTAYGAWTGAAPPGFLLALAVAVICVGWIAAVGEPRSNWFQHHFSSWSHDLGIRTFVQRMTQYASVTAFGLGVLLAAAPTTIRRRRPAPASIEVEQPTPLPAESMTIDDTGYATRAREHTRV